MWLLYGAFPHRRNACRATWVPELPFFPIDSYTARVNAVVVPTKDP
jgi:hypothetical protein